MFLSIAAVFASIASPLSLMSSFISEILLLIPEIDLSCALSAASSFSKRSLAALISVAELYLFSRSVTLLVNSASFASNAVFAALTFSSAFVPASVIASVFAVVILPSSSVFAALTFSSAFVPASLIASVFAVSILLSIFPTAAVLASTFGFSSLIAVSLASDFSLFLATCASLVLSTVFWILEIVALIVRILVSTSVNRDSTSAALTAPIPLVNTNAAATMDAFLPLDFANSDVTT